MRNHTELYVNFDICQRPTAQPPPQTRVNANAAAHGYGPCLALLALRTHFVSSAIATTTDRLTRAYLITVDGDGGLVMATANRASWRS